MPLPRTILSSPFESCDLELVSGRWPSDISGEALVIAPGPGFDDMDYALFGPGHVCRLSLRPGTFGAPADRFALRVKRIDTPSVRLWQERPEVFTPMGPGVMSPFGMMNMTNTAIMPWKGRVFTTWDVGRPVEIDPVTLEFLGEVGSKESWGPSMPFPGMLPFVFSTAHPVIDPERDCLWSVKLVPSGDGGLQIHVVRYAGTGDRVDVWPVEGAVIEGTVHTMTLTRNWLVIIDSGNFKNDPGEMAGGPRTVLMDAESPAHLVRIEDLEKTPPGRSVRMKRFMIAPPTGHFYARYDDGDGIRVMFEHMDGVDLGFYLKQDDLDAYGDPIDPSQVGFYNTGMWPSSLSEIDFDPETGRIRQTERIRGDDTYNNHLSCFDWSHEGLCRPDVHHMIFSGWRPYNVSQRALEAYRDHPQRVPHPPEERPCTLMTVSRDGCRLLRQYDGWDVDEWACSPIYAPRGAGGDGSDELAGRTPGSSDGWVVVPVLRDEGLRVDLFDAADVSKGPVARLAAPNGETLGLTLHSCWLPEARPAPDVERLRFGDDVAADLAALPDDLRAAAQKVVRDLDEKLGTG